MLRRSCCCSCSRVIIIETFEADVEEGGVGEEEEGVGEIGGGEGDDEGDKGEGEFIEAPFATLLEVRAARIDCPMALLLSVMTMGEMD